MIYPIIVRPEAEQDIKAAFSWYEFQSDGLGTEFLRCVEASFSLIARDPKLHTEIYNHIRRVLVRRFPYGIFYVFDNNKIITAIP